VQAQRTGQLDIDLIYGLSIRFASCYVRLVRDHHEEETGSGQCLTRYLDARKNTQVANVPGWKGLSFGQHDSV
jgi:hypothetical protein